MQHDDNINTSLNKLFVDYQQQLPERIRYITQQFEAYCTQPDPSSALHNLHHALHKLAGSGATFRYSEMGRIARRWEHLAQDVMSVRKTLAALSGKRDSALIGLRLGGTLVLQESIRAGGEAVLALAPIVAGATQVRLWKMRSKIRAELTTATSGGTNTAAAAETLDFDGYDVHPKFFDDVAAIDLVKDLGRLSCPGLIAQLSHRQDAAPESTKLMETLGSRAKLECRRMEAFWDKIDDADTSALSEIALRFFQSI